MTEDSLIFDYRLQNHVKNHVANPISSSISKTDLGSKAEFGLSSLIRPVLITRS